MGLFSNLFGGGGPSVSDLMGRGAVVVDVRTPAEFGGGHVKGSINIPLDQIEGSVDRIRKMGKPVVLCCASGMRSSRATSLLRQQGIECANAGPWTSVR